jgi:glucose/arabinose dehydrogenase/PKD repeat protein
MFLLAPLVGATDPPEAPGFRALCFTRTAGYRHGSIASGIGALEAIAKDNNFKLDATEDPGVFTDAGLDPYAVVIFLNTTQDVLDDAQQAAFERYIGKGRGFVGIHAASDTEYEWPWYGKLVGAWFASHPAVQEGTVIVTDRVHPSTRMLPERWVCTDEWYDYRVNPRGKVHVLARLDEQTYEGGKMGHDHPIVWCHEFGGGRAWYTGRGHTSESFDEPLFRQHLLGGILWAAGKTPGDAGATVDDHWDKVVLDDYVTDPMELAIADDGRVVFVERGGVIKVWSPDTRSTTTAGFLDVFTGLEDGLLGVALDPDFAQNGWLYVYYAPADPEPINVLSRLTMRNDRIVQGSEIVMLEVATQRQECCHSGGSIAFDGAGRLYLSTGDNTSPFASGGFTPIDERPGREPFDAQKSSANTHDLRGKILRLTPQADGSYTIPEGNLFPPDGSLGRPEIYVMGCRNPFRISVDPTTGFVYWGEVGPDASGPNAQRGPAGHDEFNRATQAGNFGWPYFVGDNLAYVDFDFATKRSDAPFDASAPVNESPNNSGRKDLPPARAAWISYPYSLTDAFPELGTGGRCAMAGPVYHFDPEQGSAQRIPEHYDRTLFIYEWARNWIRAVHLDAQGEVLSIEPFAAGLTFVRPHEMEIGPDGCLYMIEWGTGFGGGNPDARIVRLEHFSDGNRPPLIEASVQPESGQLPLVVRYAAEARSRSGRIWLNYEWDFDGDGVVDATDAIGMYVFEQPGTHPVQLTVTDDKGLSSTATIPIVVGNTRPRVQIQWPPNGGIIEFGDTIEYRVRVTDPEDGSIEAQRVIVQPALGHDTHAHPLHEHRGLKGAFSMVHDEGHPPEADLFTVLSARYVDSGGPASVRLTGRDELILQPRRKQAEFASALGEARIEKSNDPDGSEAAVVLERPGAFASYQPVNLYGIDAVRCRAATGASGAALELRAGSVSGPLLGRAELESGASIDLEAGAHPIRIEFFERSGGAGLILRLEGPGIQRGIVDDAMLAHDGQPGLRIDYYELDDPTALPDFQQLTPYRSEVVPRVDFASAGDAFGGSDRADDVGAVLSGDLIIPVSGRYALSLESDDGSRLLIDDQVVVDNDGLHGMTDRSSVLQWRDVMIDLHQPQDSRRVSNLAGDTDTLCVVYVGRDGYCKLDWIEFMGRGVAGQ